MKYKKNPRQTQRRAAHLNAFNLGLTEFDLGFFTEEIKQKKNVCAFVLDCCFVCTQAHTHSNTIHTDHMPDYKCKDIAIHKERQILSAHRTCAFTK